MKICWILALLGCSIPTFALRGGMQKATVQAMRKVPCTGTESQSTGRNGFLSGLAGSSSGGGECIEYELRTEKVSYIIRPHRAILLLLGGDVSIKLADNELLLRTTESVKDIRCAVLAHVPAFRRRESREKGLGAGTQPPGSHALLCRIRPRDSLPR